METKFNIYSGLLRAYESDGKKRFRATASSSVRDRHGDIIRQSALERMVKDAQGMTLFLNHEYNVPEDIMGSTDKASLFERGLDGEGNAIVDLDIEGVVAESNPRALQAWEALNSGVKLGMSIGAMIPAEGATRDKKSGTLDITDIQLLEASIVGIPANPRSWVQYAVKSYRANEVLADAGIERRRAVDVTLLNLEDWPIVDETGEPDVVADACPQCGGSHGKPKDGCSADYHKDAEPDLTASEDITDATTRVTVTVNTDAPGTETSGPGNAQGLMDEDRADVPVEPDQEELGDTQTRDVEPDITADVEPEVTEAAGPFTAEAFSELLKSFKEALEQNAALTKERDAAVAKANAAADIIARIEKLPLGRKTSFAAATSEFHDTFGGIYDEEFLKFMETK